MLYGTLFYILYLFILHLHKEEVCQELLLGPFKPLKLVFPHKNHQKSILKVQFCSLNQIFSLCSTIRRSPTHLTWFWCSYDLNFWFFELCTLRYRLRNRIFDTFGCPGVSVLNYETPQNKKCQKLDFNEFSKPEGIQPYSKTSLILSFQ